MSRSNRIFTQGDITRALKAAAKAGLSVRRFEIDLSGRIVVEAGQPEASLSSPANANANEWDGVVQ